LQTIYNFNNSFTTSSLKICVPLWASMFFLAFLTKSSGANSGCNSCIFCLDLLIDSKLGLFRKSSFVIMLLWIYPNSPNTTHISFLSSLLVEGYFSNTDFVKNARKKIEAQKGTHILREEVVNELLKF